MPEIRFSRQFVRKFGGHVETVKMIRSIGNQPEELALPKNGVIGNFEVVSMSSVSDPSLQKRGIGKDSALTTVGYVPYCSICQPFTFACSLNSSPFPCLTTGGLPYVTVSEDFNYFACLFMGAARLCVSGPEPACPLSPCPSSVASGQAQFQGTVDAGSIFNCP